MALQGCWIGGPKFTTLKKLVFLSLCQLTGGLCFFPFAMLYNKLSAFGTENFFLEVEVVSLNNIHI